MSQMSLIKKNYINYINHVIKNSKISHAYLVELENYDEDFQYILDFIKMILTNCSYEEVHSINNPIFHLIDEGDFLDVHIIEPDGNNIKKNQIIELQNEYNNKSLLNGKRIYIIKDAEKMNLFSANTMLKFLEEPEDDIIAFLVTKNRYLIIETILSRCQIITLKENNILFSSDENVLDLLKCVINPYDFFIKYKNILDIYPDKILISDNLKIVESIIISFINDKYGITNSLDKDVISLFTGINDNVLLGKISILEEELSKLDFNVNYKLWLDSLFSKLIIGG